MKSNKYKNDEEAFRQGDSKTIENLWNYIFSKLKWKTNHDTAKDITQETIIIALQSKHKIEAGKLKAFTYGIARRRLLESYRNRLIPTAFMKEKIINEEEEEEILIRRRLKEERIIQIGKCLDKMSETKRTILSLHYYEGHTIKKIAEDLDMKPGTLRVNFHRWRSELEKCVEKNLNQ